MVFIFHILFFLFFIWGGWPSGITGNTYTWKILSSNPTDGLGQDGLWDPHYEAPDNLQIGHVECVLLTISYPLFFLCISKVSSMLQHDLVGWFHCKKFYTLNKVFKRRRGLRACKLLKEDAGREWVNFFSGTEGGGLQFSHKKWIKIWNN